MYRPEPVRTAPTTVVAAAMRGTLSEFVALYSHGDESRNFSAGPLLNTALGNGDPTNRFEIASFLLDAGADPAWRDRRRGGNLLHHLLNHVRGGFVDTDMALLLRLMNAGADVNESAQGFGTPLQLANRYAGQGETNVIRVYDAFFSRDDIDLFNPGRYGFSTYDSARKGREYYPVFWQRVQQYIADHGLRVPDPEQVEE